jgi:hypothetical protein
MFYGGKMRDRKSILIFIIAVLLGHVEYVYTDIINNFWNVQIAVEDNPPFTVIFDIIHHSSLFILLCLYLFIWKKIQLTLKTILIMSLFLTIQTILVIFLSERDFGYNRIFTLTRFMIIPWLSYKIYESIPYHPFIKSVRSKALWAIIFSLEFSTLIMYLIKLCFRYSAPYPIIIQVTFALLSFVTLVYTLNRFYEQKSDPFNTTDNFLVIVKMKTVKKFWVRFFPFLRTPFPMETVSAIVPNGKQHVWVKFTVKTNSIVIKNISVEEIRQDSLIFINKGNSPEIANKIMELEGTPYPGYSWFSKKYVPCYRIFNNVFEGGK